MAKVSATRFTQLKAKVKAEMLRRKYSGSVANYGSSDFDYTVVPKLDGIVQTEHLDKLAVPMQAVNFEDIARTTDLIKDSDLTTMESKITAWSARSLTDKSGSDCMSGCTGTCYTGCATGCTDSCSGCGGSCSNNCSGCDGCSGCGSGCANTCSGSCSGGCSGDCGSGCTGYCTGGCGGVCSTGCGTCGSGCTGTCTGYCQWGCSSCGGDCTLCQGASGSVVG